jgi:hypothetical protein
MVVAVTCMDVDAPNVALLTAFINLSIFVNE